MADTKCRSSFTRRRKHRGGLKGGSAEAIAAQPWRDWWRSAAATRGIIGTERELKRDFGGPI